MVDINIKILRMIKSSKTDLPTLPVIVNNILRAASDEKTTTEDLARLISYDVGITNKLLRLANSVYYGQRTKTETIKRAITIIGFDEIIGITLGMSLLSTFADSKKGLPLDMKALWIHSIGSATAAKEIANRSNPSLAKKIFVPALLHDMGKIIFSVYFKEEYRTTRTMAMEKRIPLFRAEHEIFNMDHAVVAALLMKRWRFPTSILIPCRFHHNPDAAPVEFRLHSLILNLADYLSQKADIGHSGNPVPVSVKNAHRKTGTNEAVLRLVVDKLRRKEEQIKNFFEITTSD
ncbi:MAG: HDOD domain-containing protein [Desulfobacteraceae bacterium]